MAAERTVVVRLKAIVADYEAAMARAGLATKGVGTSISSMANTVRGGEMSLSKLGGTFDGLISGQMAVAAGGLVAAGVLVKLGKDGVQAYVGLAGEVEIYKRIAGGTAEESSRMVAAFHAVGIESEVGATAVFRLSQNLDRNAAALKDAGVVVARDKQGNVDLNKTLLNLSDAYRNIEDPQKRNVLMMQALGRGAIALAPLLARSREDIQAFWAAAGEHGLILSQQDLDQARAYKLAVHELGDAWKGFEVEIGRAVVPYLSALVQGAEASITAVHGLNTVLTETKHTSGESFLSQLNKDINSLWNADPGGILKKIGDWKVPWFKAGDDRVAGSVAEQNKKVVDSLRAISDLTGVARPRLQALADTMGIDLASATDKEKQALQDAAVKLNAAVTPTQKLAAIQSVLADKFATTAEKAQAYDTAISAMLGSHLDAESATLALHSSMQKLANDFASGKQEGESYRQSQDRLSGDLVDVVKNVEAMGKALVANGSLKPEDQVTFLASALGNLSAEFPELRGQIAGFAADLDKLPGAKTIDVTLNTQQATAQLNEFVDNVLKTAPASALAAVYAYRDQQSAAIKAGSAASNALGLKPEPSASAGSVNAYLKSVAQERADITDNMFKEGRLSLDAYLKALDGELAGEKAYTSAWEAIQDKKRSAITANEQAVHDYLQALHDEQQAVQDYLQSVYDEQQRMLDNEYAVGAISKDAYLKVLEDRLAGLQKYSDEWTRVWQQIQQIQSDALGAEIKSIQAWDAGRQFQQAFDAEAGQRALSASWQQAMSGSPVRTPMAPPPSITTVGMTTYSPNFTVTSSDPTTAASLTNQKMRDSAMLLGV